MLFYLLFAACVQPIHDYHIGLIQANHIQSQCVRFHDYLLQCVSTIVDAPPFGAGSQEHSFVQTQIETAIAEGGLGIFSRARLCSSGVMQLGQALQAIPTFPDAKIYADGGGPPVAVQGLVRPLRDHVGSMDTDPQTWRTGGRRCAGTRPYHPMAKLCVITMNSCGLKWAATNL